MNTIAAQNAYGHDDGELQHSCRQTISDVRGGRMILHVRSLLQNISAAVPANAISQNINALYSLPLAAAMHG